MNDDAVERLEARLDAARRRLADLRREHDAVVAASRDSNADDEHDPEGATIAFERAQVDALTAATRAELARLEQARSRVDDGTYGRCETCGEPIGDERLEARPGATRCVRCEALSGRRPPR
ncbi:TraR/DksA family transcriptional regulator [Solicola sp. PLA-1-18]|uniref:TraR/DksA family transcriptional regulator n=1 Tax=Solicola sp. PLA-1-18 TaxID=3380532 RepID=UPI003B7AAE94